MKNEKKTTWVFLYMKYRNFLKYFTATFDQAQTSYFWRVWYDSSWIWHGILADGLECDKYLCILYSTVAPPTF